MEAGVFQTTCGEFLEVRCVARTAKGAGRAKAHVVEQDDEHIGRARRRPQLPDRRILRVRILGIVGRQTHMRLIRDGQDRSLSLVYLTSHIIFSFTLSSSIVLVTSL